jgi:hypothetical protein
MESVKIEKKVVKNKSVSSKISELQNQKLETLAKNKGVKKSNLIAQLLAIGFKEITKRDF